MANPLHQFEIHPVYEMSVNGIDISLTNHSLWLIGVSLFVAFLFAFGMRKKQLIPGRMQAFVEMTYTLVEGMIEGTAGREGLKYIPVIFTLFIFIASLNVAGLIPASYTATSQLLTTGFMAVVAFVAIILIGFIKHGIKFLGLFLPSGVPLWLAPIMIPLEIISFFIRPFTLAVRLGANMVAGHIALKVFAGFVVGFATMEGFAVIGGIFPFAGLFALNLLEVLVALLQAYIFTLLTCVYLNDALHLH